MTTKCTNLKRTKVCNFTYEDVIQELKKIIDQRRKEQRKVKRCGMCVHLGTVNYYGRPTARPKNQSFNLHCPYVKSKIKLNQLCVMKYSLACEFFEEM